MGGGAATQRVQGALRWVSVSLGPASTSIFQALTHRRHCGTAAGTSCSDSCKYRPVLRTSTVAQLRRAPLEQRCFSGQWGSAPAAGAERRRLRCSIGVFCRPHRGAREPDFCRRVDTSLLPRSRSVPQAIWPRARKLAIGGKRRRSLPLAAWWWVLLAACCCCLLLPPCSAPLHFTLPAVF